MKLSLVKSYCSRPEVRASVIKGELRMTSIEFLCPQAPSTSQHRPPGNKQAELGTAEVHIDHFLSLSLFSLSLLFSALKLMRHTMLCCWLFLRVFVPFTLSLRWQKYTVHYMLLLFKHMCASVTFMVTKRADECNVCRKIFTTQSSKTGSAH